MRDLFTLFFQFIEILWNLHIYSECLCLYFCYLFLYFWYLFLYFWYWQLSIFAYILPGKYMHCQPLVNILLSWDNGCPLMVRKFCTVGYSCICNFSWFWTFLNMPMQKNIGIRPGSRALRSRTTPPWWRRRHVPQKQQQGEFLCGGWVDLAVRI